eukprot:COSAG06_NODE_1036_length_10998_cov_27.475181_4_plen_174_part_00
MRGLEHVSDAVRLAAHEITRRRVLRRHERASAEVELGSGRCHRQRHAGAAAADVCGQRQLARVAEAPADALGRELIVPGPGAQRRRAVALRAARQLALRRAVGQRRLALVSLWLAGGGGGGGAGGVEVRGQGAEAVRCCHRPGRVGRRLSPPLCATAAAPAPAASQLAADSQE